MISFSESILSTSYTGLQGVALGEALTFGLGLGVFLLGVADFEAVFGLADGLADALAVGLGARVGEEVGAASIVAKGVGLGVKVSKYLPRSQIKKAASATIIRMIIIIETFLLILSSLLDLGLV
jgi:hypothetical protein